MSRHRSHFDDAREPIVIPPMRGPAVKLCSVEWCLALAEEDRDACRLHEVLPRLHPEMLAQDEELADGIGECETCGGTGNCEECSGDVTCQEQCASGHDCQHECEKCDGSGDCETCGGVGTYERGIVKKKTEAA